MFESHCKNKNSLQWYIRECNFDARVFCKIMLKTRVSFLHCTVKPVYKGHQWDKNKCQLFIGGYYSEVIYTGNVVVGD